MTHYVIEWTGRVWGDNTDEERAIAALVHALEAGADWNQSVITAHNALVARWQSHDSVDNYIITTAELNAASPLMDDDIREAIHDEIEAANPVWFLAEYKRRHLAMFGSEFVVN